MASHLHHLTRFLAAALCVAAAAAARPVASTATAAMDVSSSSAAAPAPAVSGRWIGEGKWLPLPAAMRSFIPPGVGGGVSMPWMGGSPPAMAGPGTQLIPPYVGATRQEQLSLWASLFNPFQIRPRLPIAGAGAGETTTATPVGLDLPAIAGVSPEKTTTVDEPAGEAKWGVFLGNNGNN